MLDTFNQLVSGLPTPLIYATIAALVFAEAALFFGFVLPGEAAIVVGGLMAHQGRLNLWLLMVIAIVAAVTGDSVGYEVGRRFGIKLLDTKVVRKHAAKVESAQALIRRRGAFAVVIGRFTALLRALMPALVGSARLPYGRFLFFNALGGTIWVLTFTIGGYTLGAAIEQFARLAGQVISGVLVVAAVAAFAVHSVRKHRAAKEEPKVETAAQEQAVTE